jgi:cytochrome c-type biogenesis protein CcmH
MSIRLVFSLLLVISSFAYASIDTYEFANQEQEARYKQFIDELRCPKCQNQSLSGSNAPIAMDLRKQLYVMIEDGKSDDEIVNYMLDRYGDFILYKPRLTAQTLMLWGAPLVFLAIGLWILVRLLKSRRAIGRPQELSAEEQVQLQKLLNRANDKRGQE